MSDTATNRSSIQVIDRTAMLLDAIASYDVPASLKILSADTGLHPSTAFRILGALTSVGFVERTVQGHYQLGRKLARLAQKVQRGSDIRREALPVMEALRDRVGETVNLSIRAGDEVVYVERKASQKMIRVEQVIGSRAPLHVTGVGKLMLGTLGEDFIRAYAERTGLPAYTEHTLPLDTLHGRIPAGRGAWLCVRQSGGRGRSGLHQRPGLRRRRRGGRRAFHLGTHRAAQG